MNKFHMLLLSATICATTPTFAMEDNYLPKNAMGIRALTPEQLEIANGEPGYPDAFITMQQVHSLPKEYSQYVETPATLSTPPQNIIAREAIDPLDKKSKPKHQYNNKHEALNYLEINVYSLSLENITSLSKLDHNMFKVEDDSVYEVDLINVQKTLDYLGKKIFETSLSEEKNIDLMPKTVENLEHEIRHNYQGGEITLRNPWYPIVDFDNPTIKHHFVGQTIVLKKVDIAQFIINATAVVPAGETTATDAIYTGGAPISTPPGYTGES